MTSSDSALKTYLISKIEELEHKIQEKNQNVKRLQAQRNELNSSGLIFLYALMQISSSIKRRNSCTPRIWFLCWGGC